MKNLSVLFLALLNLVNSQSQSNALLEVESTNKGILLPRLNDTSFVANPTEGLLIYTLNAKVPFYHNGTHWQAMNNLLPPPANNPDSVTYKLTGLGTPTELPIQSVFHSVAVLAGPGSSTISFSKKFDINSVPIQQAMFTNATLPSVEFKLYHHSATTPYASYRLQNVSFLATSSGGSADSANIGGQESFAIAYEIYGYKDWVNNQSFGFNFTTQTIVGY